MALGLASTLELGKEAVGYQRRATMVPAKLGPDDVGVGERRWGRSPWRLWRWSISISMGSSSGDVAATVACTGAGGNSKSRGAKHSAGCRGTIVVHPWMTQKCMFCTWTRRGGSTTGGGVLGLALVLSLT